MANPLFSQHTRLSEEVFRRFMDLPETESFQAEYICKCTERLPALACPWGTAGTITACGS